MAYIGKIPAAAALTSGDITNGIISLPKLTDGTDGNLISYDASGNPVAVATGSDGQVLTSAGAGAPPAFEAAAAGGKIGQVISTNKTDTYSASVGTEVFSSIVTGLTVAITPSATSSKVLVFVNMNVGAEGEHGLRFQLFRGTTQIDLGAASSSRGRLSKGIIQNSGGNDYMSMCSTNFLDSPSSTSELTYGVKIGHTSGVSRTLYVNRSNNDLDDASYGRDAATITVMEVLA